MKNYFLPIEPFAELLEEEICKNETTSPISGHKINKTRRENTDITGAVEAVAGEIARYSGRSHEAVVRNIFRIRARKERRPSKAKYQVERRYYMCDVKNISLALADDIACALGRPFIFYEDPRLREVYEKIGARS